MKYRMPVGPNFWLGMDFASDESQLEEMDVKLNILTDCMRWLPGTFYSLKLLKVLKLEGVLVLPTAKGFVLLPSVKILELLGVEFQNCESLSSLISGCPVLENLHLESCYCSNSMERNTATASLPFLKNLKIIGIMDDEGENKLCPIVIEASTIEHLYLSGFTELQFLDTSSPWPCLQSAWVDFDGLHIRKRYRSRLFAQISYAKEMCLSGEITRIFSVGDDDDDNDDDDVQLPIFPNLTHLKIGGPRSNYVLQSLLNSAPKLNSLVIDRKMVGFVGRSLKNLLARPSVCCQASRKLRLKILQQKKVRC